MPSPENNGSQSDQLFSSEGIRSSQSLVAICLAIAETVRKAMTAVCKEVIADAIRDLRREIEKQGSQKDSDQQPTLPQLTVEDFPFLPTRGIANFFGTTFDVADNKLRRLWDSGKIERVQVRNKNGRPMFLYRLTDAYPHF